MSRSSKILIFWLVCAMSCLCYLSSPKTYALFMLSLPCRYLVSQGCIKPLCDLLICPDPRIVTVCLEGLENILKVGEAEKSLGRTSDINLYAQLIDDAEGLEKIENLQSHDNQEIYEKAVKILETYWLEEDDETMPPGDAAQQGFQFGGGEVSVPSGGFSFN